MSYFYEIYFYKQADATPAICPIKKTANPAYTQRLNKLQNTDAQSSAKADGVQVKLQMKWRASSLSAWQIKVTPWKA